jgi:hypothetical protein
MSVELNPTITEKLKSGENVEQLYSYDHIAALVAENKKVAEKYIKEGSVPMLIFGFLWGWVKAFLYMFIALFKGANDGGGANFYGGLFRFFRAIFDVLVFPIIYAFRINTILSQKKQAEAIIASDLQTLQEIQNHFASAECVEKSAQAKLSVKVEQIVANNELLKSFDKSKK